MNYLTTKQAGERNGLSASWMRFLCLKGRVPGSFLLGTQWLIPENFEVLRVQRGRPTKGNES